MTVKLKALPAVALAGALTAKCVADGALTVIVLLVPVIELLTVSVAVIVWLLGVRIVAYFRQQSKLATHVAAERLTIIRESLMLMRLVKSYTMEQFNQALDLLPIGIRAPVGKKCVNFLRGGRKADQVEAETPQ